MKKYNLIPVIFFAVFALAACNSNKNSEREIQLLEDPSVYSNDASTDTTQQNVDLISDQEIEPKSGSATSKPTQTTKPAKPIPAVNPKPAPEESVVITPEETNPAPVAPAEDATPKASEKKEISKTAQGAIIGGAAGAVGGAIISKKKGAGAAVGAAVGAAAGAIIGNKKDKKEKATQETTEKVEEKKSN